jgi:hypothetical protein
MNYLLFIGSIILGSLFKSYDEIVDNNLKINKEYIFFLQIIIIFLSFYLYYKDALFMIICIIIYYYEYINDYILVKYKFINNNQITMNDLFWHIYAIVLIPIFIFNYKNIFNINFNITKIIILIVCIIFILIIIICEIYLFPEENSSAKILFRLYSIILLTIITFITIYFKSYFYSCTPLIILFCIGYFATSLIFKQYIIPDSSINIIGTLTYIWKKLKSKKLQQKLKEKKGRKRSQQIKTIF